MHTRNVCLKSRQFGTSAEVSERHFCTSAELSGHFGTSLMVPKCLGSEVSGVRSVLTPSLIGSRIWAFSWCENWRPSIIMKGVMTANMRSVCDSWSSCLAKLRNVWTYFNEAHHNYSSPGLPDTIVMVSKFKVTDQIFQNDNYIHGAHAWWTNVQKMLYTVRVRCVTI